jgi:hypothetical protein
MVERRAQKRRRLSGGSYWSASPAPGLSAAGAAPSPDTPRAPQPPQPRIARRDSSLPPNADVFSDAKTRRTHTHAAADSPRPVRARLTDTVVQEGREALDGAPSP